MFYCTAILLKSPKQSNGTFSKKHKVVRSIKGPNGKLEEVLSRELEKKTNSQKNMGSGPKKYLLEDMACKESLIFLGKNSHS